MYLKHNIQHALTSTSDYKFLFIHDKSISDGNLLSAVCDCGIFWSYSLTILDPLQIIDQILESVIIFKYPVAICLAGW